MSLNLPFAVYASGMGAHATYSVRAATAEQACEMVTDAFIEQCRDEHLTPTVPTAADVHVQVIQ